MSNIVINPDLIGRQVKWSDNSGYHEAIILGVGMTEAGRYLLLVNENGNIKNVWADIVTLPSRSNSW